MIEAAIRFGGRLSVIRTLLLLLLLLLAVSVSSGRADDLPLGPMRLPIGMPEPGARVQGFTSQVQIADETVAGYLTIQIRVAAVGSFAADRRLTYRFSTIPGGQTPPRNGLTVDVPLTIEQGTKNASFVRYLPKWSAGQAIEVVVIEDGRPLQDYTASFTRPIPRGKRGIRSLLGKERELNWVYISDEDDVTPETIPDLRALFSADHFAADCQLSLPPISEAESLAFWNQATTTSRFLAIGQSSLPNDWRAYQRYDAIVMEAKAVERLRSSDDAFQAVRGWCAQWWNHSGL